MSGRERDVRAPVRTRFPTGGPVRVLIYGEAPGLLGAARSGIPFWGDRSGRLVYGALVDAGLADVPQEAWGNWRGDQLLRRQLRPTLHGAALANAYPICRLDTRGRARPPTRGEVLDPENVARVEAEVRRALGRCPGTLTVIALGQRAASLLEHVAAAPPHRFVLEKLPHPSAQALLGGAPGHGRGKRLSDLQAQWRRGFLACLLAGIRAAGPADGCSGPSAIVPAAGSRARPRAIDLDPGREANRYPRS